MQRNNLLFWAFTTITVLAIYSCNKFEKTNLNELYLPDDIPNYYPQSALSHDLYNTKTHLGRVLFYDKSLSKNNTVSCATCHKQEYAFADNVALSTGFEGIKTSRNSIAIQNIASFNSNVSTLSLFWDGRESDLSSLITKPIANHIEMGMDDPKQLMDKLNQKTYIKRLAQLAFQKDTISIQELVQSMTHFISLMSKSNSRFDKSKINPTIDKLTPLEEKGQVLFFTTYQCNKCHAPNPGLYISSFGNFANIGLNGEGDDIGRMKISNNPSDNGAFKVPDLHNVATTAPYMHDGRFKTLDEVLEHYSNGIQYSTTLDKRLQDENGQPLRLNITESDKKAIIAFLGSMTDYQMITDPLLSNPFKTK